LRTSSGTLHEERPAAVVLSDVEINELMNRARVREGYEITVDLEARQVRDAAGFSAGFNIGDFQRDCLLNGLDDIGLTPSI